MNFNSTDKTINMTVTIDNGDCTNLLASWKLDDRINGGGNYINNLKKYLIPTIVYSAMLII